MNTNILKKINKFLSKNDFIPLKRHHLSNEELIEEVFL